jgi:hypothetical protein
MGVPRPLMYLMISGGWCSNYLIRNSLPSLLPFIARAQGFTDSQLATLLGAFFPGCAAAYLPRSVSLRHDTWAWTPRHLRSETPGASVLHGLWRL